LKAQQEEAHRTENAQPAIGVTARVLAAAEEMESAGGGAGHSFAK